MISNALFVFPSVPGLGKYPFSSRKALSKGVSIVFTVHSQIDVGDFEITITVNNTWTLSNISLRKIQELNNSRGSALIPSAVAGTVMGFGTAHATIEVLNPDAIQKARGHPTHYNVIHIHVFHLAVMQHESQAHVPHLPFMQHKSYVHLPEL